MQNIFKKDSKNKLIFSLLSLSIFIFLISFASASFQLNKNSELTLSCENFDCSAVNVTIYDPESVKIVDNAQTTDNSYYVNYTFVPNVSGEYNYFYSDGTNSSSGTFEVTPTGKSNTTTFLVVFLAIITLTYTLGVKTQSNWVMMLASIEVLFFGFWILIYGVDIIKDVTTTRALGFLIWGVSFVSIYKSAEGFITEGFGK